MEEKCYLFGVQIKEREPHKTEKETKQNCKGISTLRWTTWSLKKVEFLQVAQKENVTGLSVNSNTVLWCSFCFQHIVWSNSI